VDDDSRRKYYRMTDLGRRVLAAESQRLRELVQFLDGSKPKAAGAL
jgi:DNA-binding PadR family transcriptional regulator